MTMQQRELGSARVPVSALSLGSWHTWDRATFDEVKSVVKGAVDAGVTLFDVGVYKSKGAGSIQPYDSPTDLIFAHALDRLGIAVGADIEIAIKAWLNKPGWTVTGQVDELLARGGYDSAQFLVLGDIMDDPADFRPLVTEIGALIAAGKVRYWAVNNWSAAQIIRIHEQAVELGVPTLQFAQLKYGIARRSLAEGEPFGKAIDATGISIQASDAFEGGLIFGSATSRIIALDVGFVQQRIAELVEPLARTANELGTTVGGLAIAFALTNPRVSNVLVGTRTPAQLADNLAAFDLLDRVSASDLRAATQQYWVDETIVSPEAAWGDVPNDDPSKYIVIEKPAFAGV